MDLQMPDYLNSWKYNFEGEIKLIDSQSNVLKKGYKFLVRYYEMVILVCQESTSCTWSDQLQN